MKKNFLKENNVKKINFNRVWKLIISQLFILIKKSSYKKFFFEVKKGDFIE